MNSQYACELVSGSAGYSNHNIRIDVLMVIIPSAPTRKIPKNGRSIKNSNEYDLIIACLIIFYSTLILKDALHTCGVK